MSNSEIIPKQDQYYIPIMRKPITILLLTVLLFSCQEHVDVDKPELKEIFKAVINSDTSKSKAFVVDSIQELETISLKIDSITYVTASCKMDNRGIWDKDLFENKKMISNRSLQSIIKETPKAKLPVRYSFSLPFFSKDKKAFIIYRNYYCDSLCTVFSLQEFKKINSKWVFVNESYRSAK